MKRRKKERKKEKEESWAVFIGLVSLHLSFQEARTLKGQRQSDCRRASYIKSQHHFGVCRICSVISVGFLFQTQHLILQDRNDSLIPKILVAHSYLCYTFTPSGTHWLLSLGHAMSAAVSHPLAYRPLSSVICCQILSARLKHLSTLNHFFHATGRALSFSHSLHHTDSPPPSSLPI